MLFKVCLLISFLIWLIQVCRFIYLLRLKKMELLFKKEEENAKNNLAQNNLKLRNEHEKELIALQHKQKMEVIQTEFDNKINELKEISKLESK
jgi:biopolymer transport protein ExbB/TolQ